MRARPMPTKNPRRRCLRIERLPPPPPPALKTADPVIEEERPIGVQIFGEEPHVVGDSAKIIYDRFKPDIIDINFLKDIIT